jgi:hypothetical protein
MRVSPVAVLVLALALAPSTFAQRKPVPPLPNGALKNASYRAENVAGGVAQLTDGRFEGQSLLYPDVIVKTMLVGAPARGDLDGDGVPDAAVVLATSTGGPAVYYEVAAVLNQSGQPVHVATAPLGDRIRFQWVNIRNGEIQVEFFSHGEKDPPCCPKKKTTRRFRLEPGWLREVSG